MMHHSGSFIYKRKVDLFWKARCNLSGFWKGRYGLGTVARPVKEFAEHFGEEIWARGLAYVFIPVPENQLPS